MNHSTRSVVQRLHVRPLEVLYVAVVGSMMAAAMSGPRPEEHVHLFQAVLVLTLPAMVAGLPFLYVAGAAAWGFTNGELGGPMWTITFVYTLVTVVVAICNVALLRRFMARRARRR